MTSIVTSRDTLSTDLLTSSAPASRVPGSIRVGLLGLGTVGQGLCELMREQEARLKKDHGVRFVITHALVRHPDRARKGVPSNTRLLCDSRAFLRNDFDVVVEVMGGISPAGSLVATLLRRSVPIVTANKALLAEQGQALTALARRSGAALRYEASVAAGIPVLSLLEHALKSSRVEGVCAILNGTSNYILTQMERRGVTLEQALVQAQRMGYAETDPALDLSGMDGAQKLSVLLGFLGWCLPVEQIEVEGLDSVLPGDGIRARSFGCVLKPVAEAVLSAPAPWGYVAPALVRRGHPLAGVSGVNNGVFLEGAPLGSLFLSGPGAGAIPTAASILDDLLKVVNNPSDSIRQHDGIPCHGLQGVGETGREPPRSWFLSLHLRKGAGSAADVLEFLATSGVIFQELKELNREGKHEIAGVTLTLSRGRIDKLRRGLMTSGAIEELRAFRVVENPEEGGES